MDSRLDSAMTGFIDSVGQIGASLGLSKVASQLYGLLFINSEPLCLDDMVEHLGVSKGNISINIRALEKWGAVRKVWVKGDNRKDYYVAELNTFKVISEQLKIGLSRRIDDAMEVIKKLEVSLGDGKGQLSEGDKKRIKGHLERLKKIRAMATKAKGLLKTASRISKILG